jgi:hypothetical protein
MKAPWPAVPDLLRRFVETPYAISFTSGAATVRIETNESAIVNQMRRAMVSQDGLETDLSYWKLIRDEHAPRNGRELTVLSSGLLTTLLLGIGTTITIDHGRREVLGFIGPDMSAEEFVTVLLPIIIKLSRRSVPSATTGKIGQTA